MVFWNQNIIIVLILTCFSFFKIKAQEKPFFSRNSTLVEFENSEGSKEDEKSILAMIDSLTDIVFQPNFKFKESGDSAYISWAALPLPNDEILTSRLKKIPTIIPLTYNEHVKRFIDLYANRRREMVQRMLGLSDYYFPIFEAALDRRNMPMELKHLAVVESALNPNAVSPVGATGIWQIMYTTARMLNLNIDSYIDERKDPYLATEAALDYLEQMQKLYGNWLTAIAAYNCGPGNVNKAIRRSGNSTDFWTIYPYLPAETRGYVPAFIAVTYMMNYYKEHDIIPIPVITSFHAVDTIMIYRFLSLAHIAKSTPIDLSLLEILNPSLKTKVVPALEGGFALRIPINKIGDFEKNKYEIYAEDPQKSFALATAYREAPYSGTRYSSSGKIKLFYTVKKNENLADIALYFDCSLEQLQNWNNIMGSTLIEDSKIVIYVMESKLNYYAALDSMTPENKAVILKEKKAALQALSLKVSDLGSNAVVNIENGFGIIEQKIIYKVKNGDNLSLIASRHKTTVNKLKEWNHLKSANLKIGQNLTIYQNKKVKLDAEAAQYKKESLQSEKPLLVQAADSKHPSGYDSSCNCIYYEVKSGDSLWKISQQYPGLSVDKIKKDNNLQNSSELKTGMKLKLEIGS